MDMAQMCLAGCDDIYGGVFTYSSQGSALQKTCLIVGNNQLGKGGE